MTEYKRTSFRFDLMPWKLVFCEFTNRQCLDKRSLLTIPLSELPEAPEPGRIPKGADHLHIITKMSGERDAREEQKWRALLWGVSRCDHGKLPGDRCRGCKGWAPSMEGTRVGTSSGGRAIVIPSREEMSEILKWLR